MHLTRKPFALFYLTLTLLAQYASAIAKTDDISVPAALDPVLSQIYQCNSALLIRSQSLSIEQQQQTCQILSKQQTEFHEIFSTAGKPVKHDLNDSLRINVYQSKDDYAKNAARLFNMPTDNGGMYLEGFPDKKGNQAEFITYMKDSQIWNLRHEFVHYLDGRYNLFGDFCASLHDSHSPPENCASPAPLLPHTVWWSEGIAEYIAKRQSNPHAIEAALKSKQRYLLSELFNTSYEQNGGNERVYTWGYMAVRYMMENQREKVEQMLIFLRAGDFPRYQALVKSWGDQMDADFNRWLESVLVSQ